MPFTKIDQPNTKKIYNSCWSGVQLAQQIWYTQVLSKWAKRVCDLWKTCCCCCSERSPIGATMTALELWRRFPGLRCYDPWAQFTFQLGRKIIMNWASAESLSTVQQPRLIFTTSFVVTLLSAKKRFHLKRNVKAGNRQHDFSFFIIILQILRRHSNSSSVSSSFVLLKPVLPPHLLVSIFFSPPPRLSLNTAGWAQKKPNKETRRG